VRPPVPRFVRWAVALSVIAALITAVFQYWGTSQYGATSANGTTRDGTTRDGITQDTAWTQTQWGPLGPADRDLLVMIRQVGLWGGSSGQRAQRQASSAQVRTVAQRVTAQYGNLDDQVRLVASKLGVPLPDQPNAQQQGWVNELSGQSGSDFDRMFAQRLRLTDGEVLPVITSVRAGTRNELIRSFAANTAVLVNRHMDELERTGLVDYSQLPAPPSPGAGPAAGGAHPAGQEQHIDQVVNTTPIPTPGPTAGNDANAMIAALVLIAALLVALGLLGAGTSRRVRPRSQQRGVASRRRHGVHRW
jgi:predicted outer membrane protein